MWFTLIENVKSTQRRSKKCWCLRWTTKVYSACLSWLSEMPPNYKTSLMNKKKSLSWKIVKTSKKCFYRYLSMNWRFSMWRRKNRLIWLIQLLIIIICRWISWLLIRIHLSLGYWRLKDSLRFKMVVSTRSMCWDARVKSSGKNGSFNYKSFKIKRVAGEQVLDLICQVNTTLHSKKGFQCSAIQ